MDTRSAPRSRRSLLAGGAGLAAVALAACTGTAPTASVSPGPTGGPSTPAPEPPPEGPRFDLAGAARPGLHGLALHESRRAMQGIAYDVANGRLFIAQQRDGRPGADLCVNQVSRTGKVVAHLHIDDAGHGQSFGVEPVGPVSYLWLECDADENTDAGRGTALARFAFTPGRRPEPRKFFADGVEVGCAIDPVNRRLLIRRPEDQRTMFTLFDLVDGEPGRVRARFAEPKSIYPGSTARVLQAFTVLGRHAYTFVGTGGHAGTPADPFDSVLSTIDVTTGELVQQKVVTAGRSLVFREPEGLAVDVTGGAPRLVFGLASRPRPGSPRRRANLFAVDALA
jgi:hypothetical protein